MQPGQLLADVDVGSGLEGLGPVQGRDVEVDLAGIALGRVAEWRAAGAAEPPPDLRGGAVPGQGFARREREADLGHTRPRQKGRSADVPAGVAVTVTTLSW